MKISVIVPAYNREKLLPLTLRSLLAQTVPADEIIVVDDGSTDGTAEVVESFGGTVRVIRQANGGPAAARNTGFRASKGEFIHFFDSDDVALPNKHELQLNALEESGAEIAYGPWVKGSFSNHGFVAENRILQQKGLPAGDLVKALLTNWSVVPHACLFRRDIVERVGGFPEELFGVEDQLMFLRCLLVGAKIVHSPGTLELYRSDDAGKITAGDPQSKARHFKEWARFLWMAHSECLERGIDPKRWFGFRRRAWEAARDLASAGIASPDLKSQLAAIHGGMWRNGGYLIHRAVQRKMEGLQQRITGARGHASFRMGSLTAPQKLGIKQIFQESEAKTT